MSDSDVCTAAFFRSRGKDVVTEKEFKMAVSIDLHWVPAKDAAGLVRVLVQDGCVTVKDGYIRPAIDISAVTVPVTYRISEELRTRAASAQSAPAPQREQEKDVFEVMAEIAAEKGMATKDFVKECRGISKTLGIMPAVSALLILRDMGVDISELFPQVEAYILSN